MSRLNGRSNRATEALERYLSLESPSMRSKVYEIIHLSGIEPDDPMFLVLALTGQMRVFLESAPLELNRLLSEWKIESSSSLSSISNAVSKVKKTQIEQASAIEEKIEAVSNKCVSDIKEAGMGTVGAIADANCETLDRVQQTKKQVEDLSTKLAQLNAKFDEREHLSTKEMNASLEWASKITQRQETVNQQLERSVSGIGKIQRNKVWLRIADGFWSIPALVAFGLILVGGTWWVASTRYNHPHNVFGRDVVDWNVERINNCRETKNPKCTVWIVPPGSKLRNE